ncbi:serpin family protein [Actinocatenispora rupis]|nr:serpin family protein [Actinocatenispora rupis]
MRMRAAFAGLIAVVLLAGGLTGSVRYRPGAPLLRGEPQPVGDVRGVGTGAADTRFGLSLLAALTAREHGNVVLSPASVAAGLGMAYQGARGATATALAHGLCLPATGNALLAGLRDRTARLRALPEVAASDTVWVDPNERTAPGYLDRLATGYDAGVRQVPLRDDPAGSADTVNETVSAQTRGEVPHLVDAGQLRDLGWLLTDAVYLNAKWATPFDPDDTATGPFHAPGGEVTAHYLTARTSVAYARRAGWTAVALPYRGKRVEMVALLPDGAATVPSAATLGALSAALTPTRIDLSLPKVDLDYATDLRDPLRRLGMGPAFDDGADFSGIAPNAGPIAFVAHRATLHVAEKGTVAAAATAVGITDTAAPVETLPVRFDRPYLMLVRDTRTGEPLFLSRVTNPSR